MSSHTPGPWKIWVDNEVRVRTVSTRPKNITKVFNYGDQDTTFANARLIAAAPEMYEMLSKLLKFEGYAFNECEALVWKDARALLARIKGT